MGNLPGEVPQKDPAETFAEYSRRAYRPVPGVSKLPRNVKSNTTLPAPMTYTLWAGPMVSERWVQQLHTANNPLEFTEEWEAYAMAAYYSRNENSVWLLRDSTGEHTYAVFSNGQRIWHTLEANHA